MSHNKVVVSNEDRFLRRVIYTDPNYIRDDMTVTSFAFKLRKGESGLSGNIERLTTYSQAIVNIDKYRLFALEVADIRKTGLECEHKPLPDNFAHAEIIGDNSNAIRSALAKSATFIPYPSGTLFRVR